MNRCRTRYVIDGVPMTFAEIQLRAPHWLKECTLRKRLAYGWRTWRALLSEPNYRRRTYPVREAKAASVTPSSQPAWRWRPPIDGLPTAGGAT